MNIDVIYDMPFIFTLYYDTLVSVVYLYIYINIRYPDLLGVNLNNMNKMFKLSNFKAK